MSAYHVTVIDRQRRRHRYVAIAKCWYDAWLAAANEYGLAALVMVKPARPA
jgi:type II secretory pathway component PulL